MVDVMGCTSIQGVPVVNPPVGESSQGIGTRALSRPLADRAAITAAGSCPAATAVA